MAKKSKEEREKQDWKYEVDALLANLVMSNKYDLVVLLENDNFDFPFWNFIIADCLSFRAKPISTISYELNANVRKADGIGEVMKFKDNVHKNLIICVDSDNKRFYQNKEQVYYLSRPFIYHTYTYDRETHLAYTPNLERVCLEMTLKEFGKFQEIIDLYSETIFPILSIWIHSQDESTEYLYFETNAKVDYGKWSELSWDFIEEYILLDWDNIEIEEILVEIKTTLKDQVAEWLSIVKSKFLHKHDYYTDIQFDEEIAVIEAGLVSKFPKNEAIFYFNGHIVIEKFVIPFIEKAINYLGETSKDDIETTIRLSYQYGNPFMDLIKKDMQRDFT